MKTTLLLVSIIFHLFGRGGSCGQLLSLGECGRSKKIVITIDFMFKLLEFMQYVGLNVISGMSWGSNVNYMRILDKYALNLQADQRTLR